MMKKSVSLNQKLLRYGLGAGAASLAASAQADIQYSNPLSFTADNIYFDMQNTVGPSSTLASGVDDFGLTSNPSKSKSSVVGQGTPTYGMVAFQARGTADVRDYALKLSNGTVIGSQGFATSGYFNDNYSGGDVSPGQGLGDWQAGDRGFLGLEFTVGGQTDFGWADVTYNGFGSTAGGVFTLNGYAYDDSGATIAAGAVPEPSSFALLAAGAAGIAFLKRRRQSKS